MSLLGFLLVVSVTASADYFDGNDLNQLVKSQRQVDEAMFRGYVAGVQDAFNGTHFRVHKEVRMSQASAVVSKYLEANPKEWHLSAKQLIVNTLADAFPCP